MDFQQGDLVRVIRDVYGRKISIEATVVAVTNQYLFLKRSNGESVHCYKTDAELMESSNQLNNNPTD